MTNEMPDDVETIKAHITARREAVVICLQEITLLSQRLRQKLGPAAWLEWMQTSVKDGQDDIIKNWIEKQEAAHGGQSNKEA